MDRAYVRELGTTLSVAEFRDRCGPRHDAQGRLRERPIPVCLACGSALHGMEDDETGFAGWSHPADPQRWCPVSDPEGGRCRLTTPAVPDVAAAAALRANFFQHWAQHWSHVLEMAPMADLNAFIAFLHEADDKLLWAHRGLEAWHLPYLFLCVCDFPPPRGAGAPRRKTWLRFRFTAEVRSVEDLCRGDAGAWMLLRLRYRIPRKGLPGPEHLVDIDPLLPQRDLLARPFRVASPQAQRHMEAAFPGELHAWSAQCA